MWQRRQFSEGRLPLRRKVKELETGSGKKRAARPAAPVLSPEVRRAPGFLEHCILWVLGLALLSYSSTDPDFPVLHLGRSGELVRLLGAVLSDMLYQTPLCRLERLAVHRLDLA